MGNKNNYSQVQGEQLPNIFRHLTEDQLQKINRNRFDVLFKSGETIYKQGGPFTHIAFFIKGKAKVLLEENNGDPLLLKILKPLEFIGGPGFLTDYRHYFTVVAIEDSQVSFIDVDLVKNFVLTNQQFLINLIVFLNRGFIEMYNKLKVLTKKNMNGRLADTLLYLSDKVYESSEFTTTLSRSDIANMSSMTKESAIRTLKTFKADNILSCVGNSFSIIDKKALMEISKKG